MKQHRRMNLLLTVAAIFLGAIAPAVVSADTIVTLADGSITDSGPSVSATQAISPTFDIADGAITFSGTIDITNRTSINAGQFKLGFLVEDAFYSIHPGFASANRNGAVRVLQNLGSDTKLTILSPGNGSDGDLGFVPGVDGTFDFTVLLTDAGSGNVDVVFTVAEGVNSQTFNTFTIASSAMGATSGIYSSFGVGLKGDTGSVTVDYTNAQASQVPEPATMSLLALGGIAMLRRRKK